MGIELSRTSSAYFEAPSAATDEGHDFQLVAFADHGASELRPPQDASIPLDGDAGRVDSELFQELMDRGPRGKLVGLAVEPDADPVGGGYFFSSFLFAAR